MTNVAAPPQSASVRDALNALIRDVHACFACERMAYSHVLGEASGPLDADLLFIAEAVGRLGGAVTGVPLTHDESGKRFGAFLALAGIDRSRVFVTNAVLCNPLDSHGRNRPPSAAEAARCRPFLVRTLALIAAPLVVTLGRVALDAIGAIEPHGALLDRDAATVVPWRGRTLVPMYHPSRQSTLHRPQAAQEADWRRLGAIAHRAPAARMPVAAAPFTMT
jgi:DNA polymerase